MKYYNIVLFQDSRFCRLIICLVIVIHVLLPNVQNRDFTVLTAVKRIVREYLNLALGAAVASVMSAYIREEPERKVRNLVFFHL